MPCGVASMMAEETRGPMNDDVFPMMEKREKKRKRRVF